MLRVHQVPGNSSECKALYFALRHCEESQPTSKSCRVKILTSGFQPLERMNHQNYIILYNYIYPKKHIFAPYICFLFFQLYMRVYKMVYLDIFGNVHPQVRFHPWEQRVSLLPVDMAWWQSCFKADDFS